MKCSLQTEDDCEGIQFVLLEALIQCDLTSGSFGKWWKVILPPVMCRLVHPKIEQNFPGILISQNLNYQKAQSKLIANNLPNKQPAGNATSAET